MSTEYLEDNENLEPVNLFEDEEDTMDEIDEEIEAYFNKIEYDTKLSNYYSSYSNFPYQVKKEIIINISVFVVTTIAFLYLVIGIKYFSLPLLAAELLVAFFTLISSYYTIRNIRSVSFTLFQGIIEDSINIGIRNKAIILKIRGINGKTICIKYCDSKTLYLEQDVTIFLPNNATVKQSQYGPMVDNYITIIPTDELKAEENVKELKEQNNGEDITIEDYLK